MHLAFPSKALCGHNLFTNDGPDHLYLLPKALLQVLTCTLCVCVCICVCLSTVCKLLIFARRKFLPTLPPALIGCPTNILSHVNDEIKDNFSCDWGHSQPCQLGCLLLGSNGFWSPPACMQAQTDGQIYNEWWWPLPHWWKLGYLGFYAICTLLLYLQAQMKIRTLARSLERRLN